MSNLLWRILNSMLDVFAPQNSETPTALPSLLYNAGPWNDFTAELQIHLYYVHTSYLLSFYSGLSTQLLCAGRITSTIQNATNRVEIQSNVLKELKKTIKGHR